MADNKMFFAIADRYQQGQMDKDLDLVFNQAAMDGIILLPGDGRPYAEAKSGSYELADLLLPVDFKTWKTVTQAHNGGMDVFPEWFTYNPAGFFEFTQEDFLLAFIRCKHLTKHHGAFLMDGAPVSKPDVKGALRRSLAIVRKDAGKEIYGAYAALNTMVEDDEPDDKRGRLSIEALAEELEKRGYNVRFNVITAEYEVTGTTPSGRIMVQDDLVTRMHDDLADNYTGCSFDVLTQYVSYLSRENRYNPVMDLLAATKWDGVDRLPQLFALVGVEDDPLSKTLIRKWLLQTVALLFNDAADPFGADGCLVFNGEQGAGKTSLLRHLALRDAWFAEGCSIDDRDKDTTRRIVTKWLAELGEVESTLKSDVSKLKAFVSSAVDRYRLPYGRADVVTPRHTSLAATCNSDRYLIDPTGNRRWWSIPFTRKIPREELLALDPLQLWVQVFALVNPLSYKDKAGCFRLTAEEQEQLSVRNGEYEKPSKGQEEVEDILARAQAEALTFKRMTVAEFKELWPVLRGYTTQQIGVALKRCGIESIRTTKARLMELPTPSASGSPWRE